jgi:CheY-like chemotaxis protein
VTSEAENVRILVIEDEPRFAKALTRGFEGEHYEVEVATTGKAGFFRLSAQTIELLILDLMLPGRDGLEILATARWRGSSTPVLSAARSKATWRRLQGHPLNKQRRYKLVRRCLFRQFPCSKVAFPSPPKLALDSPAPTRRSLSCPRGTPS